MTTMFSCQGVPQRPEWIMDRTAECMMRARHLMTSKSKSTNLKVYERQCEYLAEQLETAIENSRESFHRSFSDEHKAECLGTLTVLYRVAKEVEGFIGAFCSDTAWMQVVPTLGSVSVRVCSWGCDLKLYSELLRNSNKLGAAWLTCSQVEGVREAELVALKELARIDEDTLRMSLKSLTSVRSDSESNVEGNIELGTFLLKILKARCCGSSTPSPSLEAWKVDHKDLCRGRMICRGASSSVYVAKWFGGMIVAEKKYRHSENSTFQNILTLALEFFHPKIVTFLGYTNENESCSLLLELMDGDLRTLMQQRMQEDSARNAPFRMWVACDIMLQVAEGVLYMHRNRVVHRDLKSENILVSLNAEHVCAKVGGFGIAKRSENSITNSSQTPNMGTPRWMAPELIKLRNRMDGWVATRNELEHPFKSDVYSFGMLCYEILTGRLPFDYIEFPKEVREEVLRGGRPELSSHMCPQSLKNLIGLCWDPEPGTRPSFAEICEELRYIGCSLLLGSDYQGMTTRSSRQGVSLWLKWVKDRIAECMIRARQSMTSKSKSTNLKVYKRQCEYLAKQLETTVKNSREWCPCFLSDEHKAKFLGTLTVLYRVAKEVEGFIGDCCSDTAWMQVVLTSRSLHMRVCSWGCDLKLYSELLRNSHKSGVARPTCSQVEGVGKDELVELKRMAGDDEDALRRSLKSLTSRRSDSESNVEGNIELGTFLLERLNGNCCGSSPQSWEVDPKGGLRQVEKIRGDKDDLVFVYKAAWFGPMVVVEKNFCGSSNVESMMKELKVNVDLVHPNIVSIFGYTTKTDPKSSSLLMELMDGDLRTLMVQRMQEDSAREAPFSMWVACDIMLQVAEVVLYMHGKRVVHRDLKSENILVRSLKGSDAEHVCAKVGDFGISKTSENSITNSSQTPNMGTPRWMAPELIKLRNRMDGWVATRNELKHPFKSDVYSFGMLCYEILTGRLPFEDIQLAIAVKEAVLDGDRPELCSQMYPQSLTNLIKLCWDKEPGTRPSFTAICDQLRRIRFSLLPEPSTGFNTSQPAVPIYEAQPAVPIYEAQPALPIFEARVFPYKVSKFRGDYSALQVVRQLGSGGSEFVTVYLSTLGTVDRVAQKRFIGSENQCFVNEVSIMAELEHPNVVRLLLYVTDRRSCSIVMELMDEDLHNLMHRMQLECNEAPTGPFSMSKAVDVILQIARGMEYVHGMNVVHRDLKSSNILVRTRTDGHQLEVKVADFGLSLKLTSGDSFLENDSCVGTIRWMAPELLDDTHDVLDDTCYVQSGTSMYDAFKSAVFSFGKVCFEILVGRVFFPDLKNLNADTSKYDPFKSDVFSFGMVCYEILVGRAPFYDLENLNEVKERILRGERPSLPEWTPSNLKVLIDKCWQRDPSRRPSFAEITGELTRLELDI